MARGGGLTWYATLDADGVKRGASEVDSAFRRAEHASGQAFGRITAGATAAGVAAGEALVGMAHQAVQFAKASVQAAVDAEASQAKVRQTLAKAGVSWREYTSHVDKAIQAQSQLSGLDDEDLSESFARLALKTGDSTKALALNAQVMDVARGRHIDVAQASVLLGKAWDGNVSALKRLGVSVAPVTAAQDALRASGDRVTQGAMEQAKAQDKIATRQAGLAALQRAYGGQAAAYAETAAGAQARLAVSWENLQEVIGAKALPVLADAAEALNRVVLVVQRKWPAVERVIDRVVSWIGANVVPDVRAATAAMSRFWEEHGADIKRVVGVIARLVASVAAAVVGVVRIVKAVLTGDFGEAWSQAVAIVKRQVATIIDIVTNLGPILLRAAVAVGKAIVTGIGRGLAGIASGIVRGLSGAVTTAAEWVVSHARAIGSGIVTGIVDGVKAGAGRITSAVGGVLDRIPGVSLVTGHGATGGIIPGTYRGYDDRVMAVASGEAILTPAQQAMVPGGRATLDRIFRQTGGVIGGRSFASGGVVYPAPGTSMGGGPAAHHSRPLGNWQSDDAWDLMGKDGMPVYASFDGTTTPRPFSSNPQTWGYAMYLNVPGRGQLYYKHLKKLAVGSTSVRAGQVLGWLGTGVNGGPHLHLGAHPLSLGEEALRGSRTIPTGMTTASVGGDTTDGASDTDLDFSGVDVSEVRNARGDIVGWRTSDGRTVANTGKAGRAGRAAAARTASTGVGLAKTAARAVAYDPAAAPPSAGDTITGRHADDSLQDRQTGDRVESEAKAAGITNPTKLAALRQKAVDQTRGGELLADRGDRVTELAGIDARITTLKKGRASWYRAYRKAKTTARKQQCLDRITDLNGQISDQWDERRGVVREISDIDAELASLNYDMQVLDAEIVSLPDTESTGATDTSTGSTAAADGTSTLSASDRAAIDYGQRSDAFVRSMFGSPDIGGGGGSALGAAAPPVQVTVQTLHPGSPSVLADIAAAVTAAFTGGTWQASTTAASGA